MFHLTASDMTTEQIIEILGAIIGLTYIFLEYRASIYLWYAGIVMSLFYIYIFGSSHCYFWAGTYLYYLFADIYGIFIWKKRKHQSESPYEGIKKFSLKLGIKITVICALLSGFLAIFAKKIIPDSPIPIGEAISTVLSIVAMWLLAHKYVEQWILWIIVNLFYTILNIQIGLYFTAILFGIYTIVATLGYLKWRKEMKQSVETPHQL